MNAQYKRDLQKNYLVLETQDVTETDDYCIHMMEQNQIPGLLPLYPSRTDGILYLNYEITGKQSVAGLFEKRFLGYEDLLFILTGIGNLFDVLRKYLLSPEKLIFDPQYLFTEPDQRSLWFCYAPGVMQESSIRLLAEFLLKRLNHQDSGAVMLGYRFYERTQEENFSLQKSIKEILMEFQAAQEKDWMEAGNTSLRQRKNGEDIGSVYQRETNRNNPVFEGEQDQNRKSSGANRNQDRNKYDSDIVFPECEVIHKTRKKKTQEKKTQEKKTQEGFTAHLFQMVHPAVLLTTLALLAALEIVYYFGYLEMTEAGGAFFFILSAELLINSYWKKAKEQKGKEQAGYWNNDEEDEDEEDYIRLREELYAEPGENTYEKSVPYGNQEMKGYGTSAEYRNPAVKSYGTSVEYRNQDMRSYGTLRQDSPVVEEIGETRCLTETEPEEGMRLIYVPEYGKTAERDVRADRDTCANFPDIILGTSEQTVGKLNGQCDIILNVQTVSRLHARLEYREGTYYVRDLNSRNGTFLNGERLKPHEMRIFEEGDRISFANISYRAVKR